MFGIGCGNKFALPLVQMLVESLIPHPDCGFAPPCNTDTITSCTLCNSSLADKLLALGLLAGMRTMALLRRAGPQPLTELPAVSLHC